MFYKLFEIDFNNKRFGIFMDKDARRTFLEIKDDGEYVYSFFDDYKVLNRIFNCSRCNVFYVPRYDFQEKVKVMKKNVVMLLAVVTMLNNISVAQASELKLDVLDDELVISSEEADNEFIEYIDINDVKELDAYIGELDVTKEMVIEAINKNDNLNVRYKRIALTLVDKLVEKFPNINLRIFYENIKDMKVLEYTREEFNEIYPDARGGGANYNSETWVGDEAYIKVGDAKDLMKKMFNTEIGEISNNVEGYITTFKCGVFALNEDEILLSGGCGNNTEHYSKIDNYDVRDEELVVYEYAARYSFDDEGNGELGDYHIDKSLSFTNEEDARKYFDKYYGQYTKYKHTFKKNKTGYYWYGTEVA